jgi:hypothetical protein
LNDVDGHRLHLNCTGSGSPARKPSDTSASTLDGMEAGASLVKHDAGCRRVGRR